MVEPFLRLWRLNVEPHFIAFLTGKMFRPRVCLKKADLDLDFNERNVD